jgi:opacity protein-like surface antigen
VSFNVLGSFPSNREVSFQGGATTGTEVGNGAGAGLKAGVFPELFGRVVGIELESSGHGSSISFPITTGFGAGTLAQTNLWVFNSMVNLIVRYPGNTLIPYVGIGGGISDGMLTSANIPGRNDTDFEGSWTFGYQFLGGVQGNLTEKLFLFSEYKYFSANYHWTQLSLDFRSHYVLGGIGLRF